jgi:lipoate-protein ligase B
MGTSRLSAVGSLNVIDLDLEPYGRALDLQHLLVAARREQRIDDTLLLLRHPPVITIGRHGDMGNILVSLDWLDEHGVEFHRVERGGDVTYHGPGQLIGYPILDLRRHRKDVGWYMHSLEEALLRTLRHFGIPGMTRPKTIGVWLDEHTKIASLGVRIQDWITYHGFALNVVEDLSWSKLIVPCGLADVEMSSMERALGRMVDVKEVRDTLVYHFCALLGLAARETSIDQLLLQANRDELSGPAAHESDRDPARGR